MESFTASFDPATGAELLRILCGLLFAPHLLAKLRYRDFVIDFMRRAGLNPPTFWFYGAFVIETVATIGLVLDLLTVYVAVLAGIFLLVAAWANWKTSDGKWLWNLGGAEFPVFWAGCCFVVAMQASPIV